MTDLAQRILTEQWRGQDEIELAEEVLRLRAHVTRLTEGGQRVLDDANEARFQSRAAVVQLAKSNVLLCERVERMTPVVEAAVAWRHAPDSGPALTEICGNLMQVVKAYEQGQS